MKFGSVFSGVGGGDLGLERTGMKPTWQIELDSFRQKVLAHHWPDVPRYGKVEDVDSRQLTPVDLIIGGFPCQDLSVAGKRKGLAGRRSGLFWEFMRLALALRPRWVLIENVPGLLSSNEGRDMGTVLGALADSGYGWSYRVLNSQFFGVPQRRRRVYIVGHLGGICPPEILFEPEGGARDFATGGEEEQGVADSLTASTRSRRDGITGGYAYVVAPLTYARPEQGSGIDKWDDTLSTYIIGGRDNKPREYLGDPSRGGSLGVKRDCVSYALDGGSQAVARPLRANRWGGSDSHGDEGNVVMALNSQPREGKPGGGKGPLVRDDGLVWGLSSGNPHSVLQSLAIRRLIPLECERLQGFPDGWTDIPEASDGKRYAAMGDAMTVPVIEWIARRIVQLHAAGAFKQ